MQKHIFIRKIVRFYVSAENIFSLNGMHYAIYFVSYFSYENFVLLYFMFSYENIFICVNFYIWKITLCSIFSVEISPSHSLHCLFYTPNSMSSNHLQIRFILSVSIHSPLGHSWYLQTFSLVNNLCRLSELLFSFWESLI